MSNYCIDMIRQLSEETEKNKALIEQLKKEIEFLKEKAVHVETTEM